MNIHSLLIRICVCLLVVNGNVAGQSREYQIKAEFLERFTRFIEWPEDSSMSNADSPFLLCILGGNPYGQYLHELAQNEKVQHKQIVVQEISQFQQIESCNLLFIGNSEKSNLSWILSLTAQRPILTVGDSPGFAQQGVLINFYVQHGFIRFEINPKAVEKSRLKFSSRLLKLGRLIEIQPVSSR